MNWRRIIYDHPLKERFARVHKAGVLLAALLVVIVILKVFEMKRERIIEAVVGHGALLGGRGLADESMDKVGDLLEPDEFTLEGGAVGGGEVLLEPEVDVVNHGVSGCGWFGRKVCGTTCADASVL